MNIVKIGSFPKFTVFYDVNEFAVKENYFGGKTVTQIGDYTMEGPGFDKNREFTKVTRTFDNLGNVTSETDAGGFTTRYEYDWAGRLTKTTNPDGGVFTNEYDWLGAQTASTDAKGNKTLYQYDDWGNLVEQKTPFSGGHYSVKTWSYDRAGNMVWETVTAGKPGGSAKDRETGYVYNARNLLTRVNSYKSSSAADYVTYAYDAAGNRTSMTTGNGTRTTRWQYDKRGRLVKMTDPLGKSETYSYDANSNLLTKTDRNGAVAINSYDAMNRLLSTHISKNSATQPEYVQYSYAKTGATLTEQNENMTVSYVCNLQGRPTEVKEIGAGLTVVKRYDYDVRGGRSSFEMLQNDTMLHKMRYAYDSMGRLKTVHSFNNRMAEYSYDANGARAYMIVSSGGSGSLTTEYMYNNAGLVTSLVNKNSLKTISSYVYEYNLDGNQSKKTETVDRVKRMTLYVYDRAGRLFTEAETDMKADGYDLTKCYYYDTAGNRSSMDILGGPGVRESYTYEYDLNNRLIAEEKEVRGGATETLSYSYDANGNQTRLSVTRNGVTTSSLNAFDGFNRLTLTLANNTYGGMTFASFNYRPDGLRLSKFTGLENTIHLWDGDNIVADLVSDLNMSQIYVYGAEKIGYGYGSGALLACLYAFNAHGDVVQAADSGGNVYLRYRYDAFGVEIDQDTVDTDNPFRYAGEYYDKEIDKIYLRARYYSPSSGRFLSADAHWNPGNMIYGDSPGENPAPNIYAIAQSSNLYAYCMNNPVALIDPFGEDFIWLTSKKSAPFPESKPIFHMGHTSALVQDKDKAWRYFYWGPNHAL
ncbi:MAG: hypothetical protein LBL35_01315 [Clostridiales bacterium]|jgi:RHS repeat-associated protein|nr:hypothetical protein [Clostridiales bacterium]